MIAARPDVDSNGLYTKAQAARVLQLDRHTIRKYLDNGLIKSRIRKSDKKEVIPGKQLLQFWEKCIF